jgi:hypothetical protein
MSSCKMKITLHAAFFVFIFLCLSCRKDLAFKNVNMLDIITSKEPVEAPPGAIGDLFD